MNKQDISTLYDYNQWANARILNAAANLSQDRLLADASYPHGGLRGTLVHILFAEWIWCSRWQGESPSYRIQPADFPTFESLRNRWDHEEKLVMAFVARLTDERLNDPFQYKTTKGEPHEQVLWKAMAHVVNHGTQHRAEAAALLTDYGCSPGDVDMIGFFMIE
jgi:uncharacterized damage-inducible protein DinB